VEGSAYDNPARHAFFRGDASVRLFSMAQPAGSWLNSPPNNFSFAGRKAVSPDRSTVEAVVKSYFDGLYEGDADKLGAIFDATADLRWLEKGELQVLTVPDWLDRVRKRPSAKAEGKPREDFIVTIDRSDDQTAFIKVRCQLPPRYFTDYLVAMKLRDGWKIVSKSYRYDLRE
jgi:putative lumazine-binding protein